MEKELGKWLMDVAKYIVTAIVLASLFGALKDLWLLYVASIGTSVIALTAGLILVKKSEEKKK